MAQVKPDNPLTQSDKERKIARIRMKFRRHNGRNYYDYDGAPTQTREVDEFGSVAHNVTNDLR